MNQTVDTEWHLVIQSRPREADAGPTLKLNGAEVRTIDLGGRSIVEPLPARFESVLNMFEQLGMFVEGDGSFCWTAPGAIWRIFGEIYDGVDAVQYVELKGQCPKTELLQLLAPISDDDLSRVIVQLVREGVYLEVDEFSRWQFHGKDLS